MDSARVAPGLALLIAVAAATAGCASAPAAETPDVRRAAQAVRLLDGRPVAPHRIIREVHVVSCAREIATDPDLVWAREELRVQGARVRADAVVNVLCQEENLRFRRQCWKAARCSGDAITFRRAAARR